MPVYGQSSKINSLQSKHLLNTIMVNFIKLTLWMLGNFSCFFCHLLTFFKNNFFQKNLSGKLSVSNHLDPDRDRRFVVPDLGPNYLRRLSADDKSRH